MKGPVIGSFEPGVNRYRTMHDQSGRISAASSQKKLGRRFSGDGRERNFTVLGIRQRYPSKTKSAPSRRSFSMKFS